MELTKASITITRISFLYRFPSHTPGPDSSRLDFQLLLSLVIIDLLRISSLISRLNKSYLFIIHPCLFTHLQIKSLIPLFNYPWETATLE